MLVDYLMSSSVKYLFKSFAHFLNWANYLIDLLSFI